MHYMYDPFYMNGIVPLGQFYFGEFYSNTGNMELTSLIFLVIFVLLVKFLFQTDPPKINGVYSQPNKWYWLKYGVFKVLLGLRKRQQHKKVTGKSAGMGRKSRNSPEEMDRPQILPEEHPMVSLFSEAYVINRNK